MAQGRILGVEVHRCGIALVRHGVGVGLFGVKTMFGGLQNQFGPPKNYMRAARVIKMAQVFNFGSKHPKNMPAPARGSSQSSRTRTTSKLSHFTIPWYQVRLGGYFSPHEASGIPF